MSHKRNWGKMWYKNRPVLYHSLGTWALLFRFEKNEFALNYLTVFHFHILFEMIVKVIP